MRRLDIDGLAKALERIAVDLDRAETRAKEYASQDGRGPESRYPIMTGALLESCEFGARQLRAVIGVYLSARRTRAAS